LGEIIFRNIGNVKDLRLRVFDSSHDDNKLWSEGGLTFEHNGLIYGSNDGGWYLDKPWIVNNIRIADQTPIVIVEGTFGPETGNTGSAQYARFSHCVGAALNGLLGIYFIPQNASYRGQNVPWRWDLVYGCIGASEILPGNILMVDAYHPEELEKILKVFAEDDQDEKHRIVNEHLIRMREFAESKVQYNTEEEIRERLANNKKRFYAYIDDNRVGKICMYNVIGFSEINFRTGSKYNRSSYRNGHIRVGDALLHIYWLNKEFNLIYLRWDHNDVREVDNTNSKEWHILRGRDDIKIITLDDIEFDDLKLKQDLKNFMDILPMPAKQKYQLVRRTKLAFMEGSAQINWNSVERINHPIGNEGNI